MNPAPEIPVIDFNPFLYGSSQDHVKVARQVDEAFSKHGFLYLANHGIPQEMVDEAFQWVSLMFPLVEISMEGDTVENHRREDIGQERQWI